MKKPLFIIVIALIGVVLIWDYVDRDKNEPGETPQASVSETAAPSANPSTSLGSIYDVDRITKKPFGLYVMPDHSPVSPERFAGFHTGTDFETTAAEVDTEVPVLAFCDGKLLEKKYASGYGGVAVQSCVLGGHAGTVVYGHLNLASIAPVANQELKKGDFIGDLGKGYSTETDGERKHLHLGIHKGTSVNIAGYTSSGNLNQWLDPETFLNIPESNNYELRESDKAKTFVYPVTSRVGVVLDSTKYSSTGTDCEPYGILGSISNVPAVPSGQFAVRYEGVAPGGCTLQNGDWYTHIIIK